MFLLGLLFSALGDFLLDYDRVNWFVYGLAAFLIAHLFYIFSLLPIHKHNIFPAICYITFGLCFFALIYDSLNALLFPVFIYMTVLLATGIATLTSRKSNAWLIIGGLSFIVSDSLIALDKFYLSIPAAGFFIMLTYYSAQYCLVRGICLAETNKKN